MTMTTPTTLRVVSVTADPHKGAVLDKCLREAVILSMQMEANVTFVHNGVSFEVVFNNVVSSVWKGQIRVRGSD